MILAHIHHLTPGSCQFEMFLTHVIKVDKREVLRLYYKHVHVPLLFLGFPGKLPLCNQHKATSTY